MKKPPIPDWLLYSAAVLAIVVIAVSWRERADAPPAPPPTPDIDAGLPAQGAIDPAHVRPVPDNPLQTRAGTAFSVSSAGVWLTARHVVENCRRIAVIVADGRGVLAQAISDPATDVAVLKTEGGGPPLPLALTEPLVDGQRAFHPGFPHGSPGEATSLYLGQDDWRGQGRGAPSQRVLAWAETGRTAGVGGSLEGMSGAPVLDANGRVVGVTLAQSPRRGRIYAAPPEAIRSALARAKVKLTGLATGQDINVDNYGLVADGLRRDLRVAEVACLT